MHEPGGFEVLNDVAEHGLDELLVGVNELAIAAAFEDFDLFEGLGELQFVFGFDLLADQPERVAVLDRGVVRVFVNVAAEERLRVVVVAEKRRAGKPDLIAWGSDSLRFARKLPLGL